MSPILHYCDNFISIPPYELVNAIPTPGAKVASPPPPPRWETPLPPPLPNHFQPPFCCPPLHHRAQVRRYSPVLRSTEHKRQKQDIFETYQVLPILELGSPDPVVLGELHVAVFQCLVFSGFVEGVQAECLCLGTVEREPIKGRQ